VLKPRVWFLDTSSLLSMAVDAAVQETVEAELAAQRCVLLDIVLDELHGLAERQGGAAGLAETALAQLEWLGTPVDTDPLVDISNAEAIQDLVRGGRPLKHAREHWAEAVAIDIGSRLQSVRPTLLSEDYSARIEARRNNVEPLSLHKLLHWMVRGDRLSSLSAEALALLLEKADRGPECTATEFIRGTLGRVGRP
jgi:hypothetical protein